MAEKRRHSHSTYDYSLLFTVIGLTLFGLLMIYSSSSYRAQLDFGNGAYFVTRQGVIAVIGFLGMILISRIDYHIYARFVHLGIALAWILMIAVTLFGREVNGKKRWLGVGSFSFQPTELVKIVVIVALAAMLVKIKGDVDRLAGLVRVGAICLPLAGIVAMNNLSSGIIIAGIGFVMVFVASKQYTRFVVLGIIGVLVYIFAAPVGEFLESAGIMQGYQLSRIKVWMNPEAYPDTGGFQVLQGLYAIGSGGLFGKGLGESIQKLGFVPEAQNDMIFSIICEELGFFGAISLIVVFVFMLSRFFVIAISAPDRFGMLLVVGVMAHIAIQVILNVAVVTNSMPNTGITLPFISYGGTSIVFLMAEMGIVLSVSRFIRRRS